MKNEKVDNAFIKVGREMTSVIKLEKEESCGQCNLCVEICEKIGVSAITKVEGDIFIKVSMKNDKEFRECIGCGICVNICPKNAITLIEENGERELWGKKFKLAQCQDCGKYYATEEQIKYIYSRANIKQAKPRCEKCKRKSSVKDIIKYI